MHRTLLAASAAAIVCPALFAQDLLFATDGSSADALASVIAPIGDVDGDGHRDLIVGAPGSGTVHVLSGVHGQALVSFVGPVGFGTSVASAGDVDGDGLDDVAVGDPVGSGSVTVHSSATGALLRSYAGGVDGGDFGAAVLGVGDVDGDGTPDLAIGAPGWSADAGAVVIVSGAGDVALLVAHGARPGARYGASLDVGDLATDDEPGLVIGAVATDDEPGLVIGALATDDEPGLVIGVVTDDEPGLVIGATDDEPGLVIGAGAESHGFASVVTHADDVDGDGRSDLLVTTPGLGRVSLHSSLDGAVIYDVHGGDTSSRFGVAAAVLHDIDGDAIADFAIGDPDGLGAAGRPGRVTVHSGADGALLHAIEGGEDGGHFGASLAGLSGATSSDLAVGAPDADGGRGQVVTVALSAGVAGDAPLLLGTGAIAPGEVVTFSVDDAPAGAPATLVLGGALVADTQAGALVPRDDVVVPGLVTDVLGRLHVTFAIPSDAQLGELLYAQVVVTTADGTLRSNTLGGAVAD